MTNIRKMDSQIRDIVRLISQDEKEVKAALLNYHKSDATQEQMEELLADFEQRSLRTIEVVKLTWGIELEEYRYTKGTFESCYDRLLDLVVILQGNLLTYKWAIKTMCLQSYVLDVNDRTNNWIEVIQFDYDDNDIYVCGRIKGEYVEKAFDLYCDYERMEQYFIYEGKRIYALDYYNPNVKVDVCL